MKRIKFTKTNIEKLKHPTGNRPDKYFASNCPALAVVVQAEPSLVKSYYGSFGKIITLPDGKLKRTGRYKYICRVGDKPLEAVMNEVIEKIRSSKENEFFFTVNTNIGLSKEFERLLEYVNQHSNIRIEKLNCQSIAQMQDSPSYRGASFNFKIVHQDNEEFEKISF